jgi:hypothetical protein
MVFAKYFLVSQWTDDDFGIKQFKQDLAAYDSAIKTSLAELRQLISELQRDIMQVQGHAGPD